MSDAKLEFPLIWNEPECDKILRLNRLLEMWKSEGKSSDEIITLFHEYLNNN